MAALTDLTFQQLQSKLPAGAIRFEPAAGGTPAKVLIDVSLAGDITADALTDTGVVKLMSLLFRAANLAQTEANSGQIDGEKLTAFSAATLGAAVGGYVPLTRTFVCRAELASAEIIIGSNG